MIHIHDLDMFISIINVFNSQNVQAFLYGKMEETYKGTYAGLSKPPNNKLSIQVLALTTVGTIYCHYSVKLSELDEVENAKELYRRLSVVEADLSYDQKTNRVTIN